MFGQDRLLYHQPASRACNFVSKFGVNLKWVASSAINRVVTCHCLDTTIVFIVAQLTTSGPTINWQFKRCCSIALSVVQGPDELKTR